MKRLLTAAFSFCFLLCCRKPENLFDRPVYKATVAHSWQSDSVFILINGATTPSYSSAGNYEVLRFDGIYSTFITYEGGQIKDSARKFTLYEPDRLLLSPDTNPGGAVVDYADIKLVTDTSLVLERHTSTDSISHIATTYYHAL